MLFLHQLTFSTKIIICRKTNIFIFNALANKDTCRKSNRVVYMYYVEKIFFLDMFLGVPFQVGLFRGSVLTVLPRCRFVPRLQCYRTASDSLAPFLSLTQRNACQPYCRDSCPRHGAVRQSGVPAASPTAALRSAVG